MVFIKQEDGIERKFACLQCVKGHRSTKCKHALRELIEIRRSGRPISQCESCRQKRRKKGIHVKCDCEKREQQPTKNYESNSSSEGSITPPIRICQPAGLKRHMIPIHDPTDDIDSDTPQYKPEEECEIPDKAVLGNLTDTTSEELMNRIYSAFKNPLEEDQLAELT